MKLTNGKISGVHVSACVRVHVSVSDWGGDHLVNLLNVIKYFQWLIYIMHFHDVELLFNSCIHIRRILTKYFQSNNAMKIVFEGGIKQCINNALLLGIINAFSVSHRIL